MSEILTAAFLVPLFTAGVRMSVPLIFGSVGDVVSERSGVMNIGLEGEMLVSALISFMAAYHSSSIVIGILAGGLAGMCGALLIAFWGVSRKQDQSVVGIMFNIFALGFTNFLYRAVYGVSTDKIKVDILKNIEIPVLSRIPFIGDIFFKHNVLVYIALIAAALVWFLLKYTNLGLKVDAAGENPRAAAAAGIGGAFLSCGIVGTFTENMSSGRGFICLAITILARWNPVFAVCAAFMFGTVEALQLRLQALGSPLPYQFFVALPYAVTLISLVIFGRNIHAPRYLGQIYHKESR